jgi:hypothetical protein
MAFKMDDNYIDVAARIQEFRAKYPDGVLQPWNQDQPFNIVTAGDAVFIVVVAAAYRYVDDPLPGVGMAWEPFPGKTPYTKDSELMNAETSAWGRAIVAVGAADAKKVASANEMVNRENDRKTPPDPRTALWTELKLITGRKKLSKEEANAEFQRWSKSSTVIMEATADQLTKFIHTLNHATAPEEEVVAPDGSTAMTEAAAEAAGYDPEGLDGGNK